MWSCDSFQYSELGQSFSELNSSVFFFFFISEFGVIHSTLISEIRGNWLQVIGPQNHLAVPWSRME